MSFEPEETGPRGLQERSGFLSKPNLMLIPLVGGWPTQLRRLVFDEETLFVGVAVEDVQFLFVMGRTALKTSNCFAASAEFFKMCLERESLKVCGFHMWGH